MIGGTRVAAVVTGEDVHVALPASLLQALRIEFGRALHAPYVLPSVVVVNGLLMTGLWLWAPGSWKNSLFSLHGPLAFALVLGGWMIADVPATNLLGGDPRRIERPSPIQPCSGACSTPRTSFYGPLSPHYAASSP